MEKRKDSMRSIDHSNVENLLYYRDDFKEASLSQKHSS